MFAVGRFLNQTQLREKIKQQLRSSTDPVERIRLTALLRGPGGIRDIGRIFMNMDIDHSGSISLDEFQQGVAEIGCILDHEELLRAYNEIDEDGSGSISYREFLTHLRDKILNKLRERIVRDVFQKLDADDSGQITIEDLQGLVDVSKHPKVESGEWTEERALDSFLSVFDTPDNYDGTITQDEFFSYYAGVSACIVSDMDFVLMMDNIWHIGDDHCKKKKKGPITVFKGIVGMEKKRETVLIEKYKYLMKKDPQRHHASHPSLDHIKAMD